MTEFPPPPPGQPYAPAPMLESEARTQAMLAHLLGIFFPVIGPLVMWLVGKDRSALIDFHGKEAVNFGITWTIGALVTSMSMAVLIGFLLFPVFLILALIWQIMASLAANRGEYYRYPMNIRFIS